MGGAAAQRSQSLDRVSSQKLIPWPVNEQLTGSPSGERPKNQETGLA
jgi:hypothetical protein